MKYNTKICIINYSTTRHGAPLNKPPDAILEISALLAISITVLAEPFMPLFTFEYFVLIPVNFNK